MGMKDFDVTMQRVREISGYAEYFEKAFGKNNMSSDNAAKAVAAFERTLITPNSIKPSISTFLRNDGSPFQCRHSKLQNKVNW